MFTKDMIDRIKFFKENGSMIVGESMLSALYYAKAEKMAEDLELEVTWEYEEDSWLDFIGDMDEEEARQKFESGEWEVFVAYITDGSEDGYWLAGLGGIILSADDNDYKRTIEAELMAEAIETIKKQ